MSVDVTVEQMDAELNEIERELSGLGFIRKGASISAWHYSDRQSKRGVWAYPDGYHSVTFTTYMNRNEHDMKIQWDSALHVAKKFGGRIFDLQTGKYVKYEMTREDKVKYMERRLMR